MSYHIELNDYYCSKCNAQFIPYEKGILCPNCKALVTNIPEENFRFIDELIGSLMVNKRIGGEFIPMGWLENSFVDSIQYIIFNVFYAWDKNNPRDGETFIKESLNSLKLKNEELYLKDHIISIALKVYSRKKELHFSWWDKFLSKLKEVLP